MAKLDEELKEAKKWILSLKENWDNEGGKSFKKDTMDRVTEIIKIIHNKFPSIPIPMIAPYVNGSIDIHWRNDKFELLMNIPEGDGYSGYYCDNYGNKKLDGKFYLKLDRDKFLLDWIENILKG